MDVVEMHERAQAVFTDVLRGVADDDLVAPTPCREWTVSDLLKHVVEGNQHTADRVGTGALDLPEGDRTAVHEAVANQVSAALHEPGWQERIVELPFGMVPAPVFITIRSGDLYAHAWDLATAIKTDTDLDRELGEAIFAATAPVLSPDLRGEGRPFGPEQPCEPTRPVADRLAAFLGREV